MDGGGLLSPQDLRPLPVSALSVLCPQFSLAWRPVGSAVFPVITRVLESVPESIRGHGFAGRPQDPPVGVFERLLKSSGAAGGISEESGIAVARAWFGGRDDSSPDGKGRFRRETEWIGYPQDYARLIFPHRPHFGRLFIERNLVLLREQVEAFGSAVGWRSFALIEGHHVEVAAFGNGVGRFVADDPELVLADSRAELLQIAAILSIL